VLAVTHVAGATRHFGIFDAGSELNLVNPLPDRQFPRVYIKSHDKFGLLWRSADSPVVRLERDCEQFTHFSVEIVEVGKSRHGW
jgi:hypothetical protein